MFLLLVVFGKEGVDPGEQIVAASRVGTKDHVAVFVGLHIGDLAQQGGLATALVILRGALIRTGIGALIVGAGELVYQFSKLVEGAGGFGAALGLLKDLASEV